MRAAALGLLLAIGGCATVDIYQYQPKPLPAGSQPLAVVAWTLQDLRNVSWSYGEPDPDPSRRAELAATPTGLTGSARETVVAGSPLDLSYGEIVDGVRMVTQFHGAWTIYIYDHRNRLVQIEFNSYAAARLFLDASYALARQG
jgi:hypothetical protein